VATPLIVYNIPHRTGRGLGPDSILALAELPEVIGVKQSVGALDRDTLEILRQRPPTFELLAGDDAYIAPTILMGGAGAIAAAAHVCTSTFAAMTDAALRGEVDRAVTAANLLLPVVEAGYREPSPAGWKAALHATEELASPALRRPMIEASSQSREALLRAIANVLARACEPWTSPDQRRSRYMSSPSTR
jgi:4-hydroxy-tetrahydrodipicolinate synthase